MLPPTIQARPRIPGFHAPAAAPPPRPEPAPQRRSTPPGEIPEYLTRVQAAAYLTAKGIPMSKSNLEKRAYRKQAPEFVRFSKRGHPRYARIALDAWIAQRIAAFPD